MRGDILSVATIFHQTGGPSYPAPEQKLPSHGALQVPEMLLLLKSPLNYGETLKKMRDYLGVFPNRGWGLLNPKTFVI